MSIPLHPPQSVTDAHMPELLSLVCRLKDGREIVESVDDRKCLRVDMLSHKLKNFAIFKLNSHDLVYIFCQHYIEIQSFIKMNKYFLLSNQSFNDFYHLENHI